MPDFLGSDLEVLMGLSKLCLITSCVGHVGCLYWLPFHHRMNEKVVTTGIPLTLYFVQDPYLCIVLDLNHNNSEDNKHVMSAQCLRPRKWVGKGAMKSSSCFQFNPGRGTFYIIKIVLLLLWKMSWHTHGKEKNLFLMLLLTEDQNYTFVK